MERKPIVKGGRCQRIFMGKKCRVTYVPNLVNLHSFIFSHCVIDAVYRTIISMFVIIKSLTVKFN